MIQKFSSPYPSPLRGLPRPSRPVQARSAFALATQRLLPGFLLKATLTLGLLELVPGYGLFLGDLFGQVSNSLSFALSSI